MIKKNANQTNQTDKPKNPLIMTETVQKTNQSKQKPIK